jgi:tRNA pseudouridine55 synthase
VTGLLLIDKPAGPTSHDVVARVRQVSGERRVGHTGTLDPRASGLLPLLLGKATRLASILTGGDKTYLATIRLGVSTDTDDADGIRLGEPTANLPDDQTLRAGMAMFRGTFSQTPPAHSAKKIKGQKAYELARRAQPVDLAPVTVTVRELVWLERRGDLLDVQLTATAGFYVRALARDLGAGLGCGAHLESLRRTRSGLFDVSQALPLDEAERLGRDLAGRLLTASDALPQLAAITLTPVGLRRVLHGNAVGPEHLDRGVVPPAAIAGRVRLLSADGELVALADVRGGALHPVIVLG